MLLWFLAPLEFLLPGYGWVGFSGLIRRFSIVESIVISFILSLSFTALFTAALSLVTSHYLEYSIWGSLALSLVLIAASSKHRKLSRALLPKFNPEMLSVFVIACLYSGMLGAVFWSSPFYPTGDASDPIIHAQVVQAITSGFARSILLHSNFAIGMHFAAAVLAKLIGLNALDAIRLLLSLVMLCSVFLTYSCARTILGARYAIFAAIAWAFIVPADATHFINIGTFPNILSDALVVATLWLIGSYVNQPSHSLGLTVTLLATTGLFVHSTFSLFLFALWLAVPALYIYHNRLLRNYLKGVLFGCSGLFVLLILLGSFASASFERVFTGYIEPSFLPSSLLVYFQVLLTNYYVLIGPLATLVIFGGVLLIMRRRSGMLSVFLCVWFVFFFVIAFVSPQDWRFVLLSMIPGSFLIGASIGSLTELRLTRFNWPRASRILIPILLCVLILSGSFPRLLPRVFSPSTRAKEEAVFASMTWLKQNDVGQGVASVGLASDYRYLSTLTGIPYIGDFNESANSMIAQARTSGFTYVVVSVQGPQFPTFESSSTVVEKYQNSVAAIFFIPP